MEGFAGNIYHYSIHCLPQLIRHTNMNDEIEDDDEGLSLDELSAAYAEAIGEPIEYDVTSVEDGGEEDTEAVADEFIQEEPDSHAGELSPRTILEAMLFVGRPDNETLNSRELAALMRGVSPQEIDQIVVELNDEYQQQNHAFCIVPEGGGYRLALRPDLAPIRENFYGKIRTAQLSQAAVDVLALIAYQQPITRSEVDEFRGKPSGALINQLLRRQLVSLERPPDEPKKALFRTTDRFLDFFGIESLKDLPHSHDLDRA